MDFNQLFNAFNSLKVAVVGDIMLDTYWWGNVERISPEAPVPVVALSKKELRIGGAGNVALNTVALGAKTVLFSVIGNDEDGKSLNTLLQDNKVDTSYLVFSNQRLTTNKTRIISRNQQMMRLDAEMTHDINQAEQSAMLMAFEKYIHSEKPDVVIFEDYNKGVLTESTIETLIDLCVKNNIITTVDPKRKNFFSYKNVTLFKPNLKEVKDALNVLVDDVNIHFLQEIHQKLKDQLHHNISLITLSEKGIFYNDNERSDIIPTYVRKIADVSGAGDTVISVASLVYAVTKDIELTAKVANMAGGIVCEEVGTAAISKKKLLNECTTIIK